MELLVFLSIAMGGAFFFAVTVVTDDFHFGFHDDSPWSLRAIALFAVGFGATGFLAETFLGAPTIVASILGCATGAFLGWCGFKIGHAFEAQQGNSISNNRSLVGKRGVVTEDIAPGRPGQVQTKNEFGDAVYMMAYANKPLVHGTPVTVTVNHGAFVEVE